MVEEEWFWYVRAGLIYMLVNLNQNCGIPFALDQVDRAGLPVTKSLHAL